MKVPASLPDWPARASRHASQFVPLLLGAGIGTELARIAMTVFIGFPPAATPASQPNTPTRARGVSVASIVSAGLFGRLDPVVAQNPDEAPASTATLKLVGTLAGRDPASGLALIADDGKATVLKPGDSLSGVALRYVYPDHVILDRAGTLERLSLERAPPGPGQDTPGPAPSLRSALNAGASRRRSRS